MKSAKTSPPASGHWATFPTPLGICGLSWNALGITAFRFPEPRLASLHASLKQATGNPQPDVRLPAPIRSTIRKVQAHLEGKPQDFRTVMVDFGQRSPLALAVYRHIREIPAGEVITYGALARRLGKPGASRAVGTILGRNPVPLIVPCHRIVAASGKFGGFTAPGGVATKCELLRREGVPGAH